MTTNLTATAQRDIIDQLAIHNIHLAAVNQRHAIHEAELRARIAELEDALDRVLAADDNGGFGFIEAMKRAREARRGK